MFEKLVEKINSYNEDDIFGYVTASIMFKGDIIAELNFTSADITYADDGMIYIRYDDTDVSIPCNNAVVIYHSEYDTFEIKEDDLVISITF